MYGKAGCGRCSLDMTYHLKNTDEELLTGCRAGDRLAQRHLYERYFSKGMGICMRYSGSREEALEVLNLAFLKVFQNLDKYQPSGTLGSWIARIAFNTAMDHLRSQQTYRKVIHFPEVQERGFNDDAFPQLEAEYLYKMVQELTPAARSVFSLYVIDGYRHKEIGEMLGMDEATSRWHLAQARKSLQARITKEHLIREPRS